MEVNTGQVHFCWVAWRREGGWEMEQERQRGWERRKQEGGRKDGRELERVRGRGVIGEEKAIKWEGLEKRERRKTDRW